MVHPRAFSFQIYLPTGEPSGVRIVDRSNWTGQGIAFPRSRFTEARTRSELERTGVYVLWNRDETDLFPSVYIGEAERVSSRLYSHDTDPKKDFWTDAVAFTTKDDSLDKAHAQYLEARLIQIANQAGRCKLENAQAPAPPSLPEAKIADAERFLEDLLRCLPIVGVYLFESPAQASATALPSEGLIEMTIDYTNSNSERLAGIKARGYETADGFVVFKDSLAALEESPGYATNFPNETSYRKQLVDQGVLVKDKQRPNAYRFTQDLVCSSPSRAAGVVRGVASNGRENWKDAQGRSLNDLAKLDLQQGEVAP